jgi:hypothetical protein
MSEIQSTFIELVRPFVDAWAHRDERKAAKKAGTLTFWRSGMLSQLEAIAAGTATQATLAELRKNFNETAERVNHSMIELKAVRGKLAGSKVASQVDKILFDFHFGKSMIRSRIQEVVNFGLDSEDNKERARGVCNDIKTLNSELERLYKMVYEA